LTQGDVLVISGLNGSGKSTLLKLIAGLFPTSSGTVSYRINDHQLDSHQLRSAIGFFAPYYHLFVQLSAYDNIDLFNRSHLLNLNRESICDLFEKFQLKDKHKMNVKNYSSGMRQRLKLMVALMHSPQFLLMDEPTSNFDVQGKSLINSILDEQKKTGITVICTNELSEMEWGNKHIEL